jgi:hypothetical protein
MSLLKVDASKESRQVEFFKSLDQEEYINI